MAGLWLGPVTPTMPSVYTQGNLKNSYCNIRNCHLLSYSLTYFSPTISIPSLSPCLQTSPYLLSFVYSGMCSYYPAFTQWLSQLSGYTLSICPFMLLLLQDLLPPVPCFPPKLQSQQGHFAWCPLLSVLETRNKYGEHLKSFPWSYTELLLRYLGGTFKVYPLVPTSARPWNVFSLYHRYQLTLYSRYINWKWT